ncbi:MAG: undecaprenyl diphosphate synthase family protein [Candidatus Nanohaloarchaeota archaeon QJJ-7]|nr:undecaprenyl diphosphate synthase family protein [Candidatus Nanohaloarchaeota archaeon QJJ-7]
MNLDDELKELDENPEWYQEYVEGDLSLHLGIIPDGNRRYADSRGLGRGEGHLHGAERAVELLDWVSEYPFITEVTAWALSPANYRKRSDREVRNLNRVYAEIAQKMEEDGSRIHENEIRVETIGDLSVLEENTRESIRDLKQGTSDYGERTLNLAFHYDSDYEIDQALESAREEGIEAPSHEDLRERYEISEVDILMRYGSDSSHLSNFAPMDRMRQATIVFPGKNFPEAEKSDIDRALERHYKRDRTEGA